MATRRYGLSRGERDNDVTEAVGAATVSDSIELTVDLTANLTKNEVMQALETFERYLLRNIWPPA